MKNLIFGSTAARYWFSDFRDPKDFDLIGKDQKITKEKQVYWNPAFEKVFEINKDSKYVDPDILLTIKASHAGWDIHWQKTMFDVLFFKNKGLKINKDLYELLVKDWYKIHGRKSAPLKGKNSKTFFEDKVNRIYIHDDLHYAVAYYDKPIFERVLKHEGTVECSEEKFRALSFEDQIKMAKEEIFVTALERWLIPCQEGLNSECWSEGRAYNASLRKFVTTMSSGWMTYFLIDNFEYLKYNKEDKFLERFNKNKNNCKRIIK